MARVQPRLLPPSLPVLSDISGVHIWLILMKGIARSLTTPNNMDEAGARARINSMTRPPDVKEIEKTIETIRVEKEAAIKAQDYEKAAALRDSEQQFPC
jgi:excinuclease UvrABC helicase subunit UvrB